MSLFESFFKKSHTESAILVDIGAGSIFGSYAQFFEHDKPLITFATEVRIEPRPNELRERAMSRALGELGDRLIREGAPAHRHTTGSGHTDSILVSVDAPWQITTMRTEVIEQKAPFTFSRGLLATAIKRASITEKGFVLADESVIGTILNGYEVTAPFGKRVTHAKIVILSSAIAEVVAIEVADTLRRLFHTHNILLIAGASLRYQALRRVFPHEQDALILDANGPEVSLALVRHGYLVAIHDVKDGAPTSAEWIGEVKQGLAALAADYPLPHRVFLLARESESGNLKTALEQAKLGELWFSEDPPRIIAVTSSNVGGLLRIATDTKPELMTSLMTLYWQDERKRE